MINVELLDYMGNSTTLASNYRLSTIEADDTAVLIRSSEKL